MASRDTMEIRAPGREGSSQSVAACPTTERLWTAAPGLSALHHLSRIGTGQSASLTQKLLTPLFWKYGVPIVIPDSEITITFVRASGPGGQNVNKVSTSVQLRFDIGQSRSLPDDVRQRLLVLAGNRVTHDGVLIITSRTHRTQEANRADARARFDQLIARAEVVPKSRRPTRPTLGSKVRRLTEKSQRSSSKKLRGRTIDD